MKTRSVLPTEYLSLSWESVAPLIFPPVCVLCGAATEPTHPADRQKSNRQYETFCLACETSLIQSSPMMRTACDTCGWPSGARSARSTPRRIGSHADDCGEIDQAEDEDTASEGLPCAKCHARKVPHRFDRITPLYRYHDAARDAVVAAKYPHNSVVARELAIRLAARCHERWPDLTEQNPRPKAANGNGFLPAFLWRPGVGSAGIWSPHGPIVTSVPSPWIRQVRRGGSGTRLLAQYTAARLRLPYVTLLRTRRQIAKQALLDDDARRENVSGAFCVRAGAGEKISGREIVLVDDVMTTGATANEIAGVLLDAGARKVSLAVVAMALRED
ncbi:ComF family protein [Aporhodopirellula aestuarii]|uniref:ComF family protein n=1 Tax=Aporhodopirellula aestuarii TaxID=2950107 RepID=A0ABT0UA17_9BACT|nr:phosphoribosyltransferase family protein [Aporhodopirellula aestuarii]MCM2373792.1 ComF family protein [Aporhodopirellula aestuarii]